MPKAGQDRGELVYGTLELRGQPPIHFRDLNIMGAAMVATFRMFKARATGSPEWAELWEAQLNGLIREDQRAAAVRYLLRAPRGKRPRPAARVLAALLQNPGATDEEIARAAEVNRTSLYRMPRFRAARAAQGEGKARFPKEKDAS